MMTKFWKKPTIFITVVLASAFVFATSVAAPQLQTNLLTNATFESGFGADGVASGWLKWVVSGSPTYKQITSSVDVKRVSEGASAQQIEGADIAYVAGLQQTVAGLTTGKTYKFSVYGHAWATTGDDSNVSTDTINLRVGVGSGSTYAADPNIKWSAVYSYTNSYGLMTVEFVATDTTATVFTWAEASAARKHNDVYWDNATFVEVSTTTATDESVAVSTEVISATQDVSVLVAPTDFPMPTPDDTGQVIYYVKPNDNLVHIATIACGETIECLEKIRTLNPGLVGDIIYPGQKLIIGEAQTLNTGEDSKDQVETPTVNNDNENDESIIEETVDESSGSDIGAETTLEQEVVAEATLAPEETGAICVTLYSDLNGNGVLDAGEDLVGEGVFSLVFLDSGENIGTYNTDGTSEPYCFNSLPTGTYRVISTAPVGYTPTTRVDWDLTLAAGSTANLEFGAQFTGEEILEASIEQESTPIRPALMGAFGVMLLLSAAGIAGYLLISKRNQ